MTSTQETEVMKMENKDRNSNRRKFLRLSALAGIAGFLAGRVTETLSIPSVRADDGAALIIDEWNTGSSRTSLRSAMYEDFPGTGPALLVVNSATAVPIGSQGTGVEGTAEATSGVAYGVAGFTFSPEGQAVHGHALATQGPALGVAGYSDSPDGVAVLGCAVATQGPALGVAGYSVSPYGTGVSGACSGGIGVLASSSTGKALKVDGVASFSTAGAGFIPAKSSSVDIADTRVTGSSHVTITFTDNPGKSTSVQWISRKPGVGFTVNLTDKVARNTSFTYLIVEPS